MNKYPYIKHIFIKECYSHQNLRIPIFADGEKFKHLVITGKNGSGKTTVLNDLATRFAYYTSKSASLLTKVDNLISNIDLDFLNLKHPNFPSHFLFSHLTANRNLKFSEVQTPVKDEVITNSLSKGKEFTKLFKQFLVNKKVQQAFDFLEKKEILNNKPDFFDSFTDILKRIFNDNNLKLNFIQGDYEFKVQLTNGQEFTFNQFSAGFFSYINIVLDLLIRTDIIRKEKQDYTFNPPGIVLIDEPDVHLHLEMQYQILPLLIELFPNIQFIVATHSPAIISSIKGVTVFDISEQRTTGESVAGSSYSELMIKHFGLENEFSGIAEDIFTQVDNAFYEKSPSKLKQVLNENERFLTPSLKMEIESRLIILESERND